MVTGKNCAPKRQSAIGAPPWPSGHCADDDAAERGAGCQRLRGFRAPQRCRSIRCLCDNIEWDQSRGFTEGSASVYHGHEGLRQSFRSLLAAFSVIEFTVEEITEVGGLVLARVHERDVGRTSGVEVDRYHYTVWTIQDGKMTRMRVFLERDDALEAAGQSG
jgi:ketosteroid isomerase-like protein